jgi:hypothetical protein
MIEEDTHAEAQRTQRGRKGNREWGVEKRAKVIFCLSEEMPIIGAAFSRVID